MPVVGPPVTAYDTFRGQIVANAKAAIDKAAELGDPGTVPMKSEKLYEAVRGVGGTVRLVMLPYESHGYAARESIEHVLYEMLTWFDRYVKNAPPRKK